MFAIQFFASKISAFDVICNAPHTFIRIPIAALLAWRATAQLSPSEQLIAAVAGGLIALAAHVDQTAVRAAVTPSPEPVSNISLSLGEDAITIFLAWFTGKHPYVVDHHRRAVGWVVRSLPALLPAAEREMAT